MRYQRCKYWDSGWCYNPGLRNGLNSLACIGSDRCDAYKVESKLSRVDVVGQNGNCGIHYEEEDNEQ